MANTRFYRFQDPKQPDRVVTVALDLQGSELKCVYAVNRCSKREFYVDEDNTDDVLYKYVEPWDPFSKTFGKALCQLRLEEGHEHVVTLTCTRGVDHPFLLFAERAIAGTLPWPHVVKRVIRHEFTQVEDTVDYLDRLRYEYDHVIRSRRLAEENERLRDENSTLHRKVAEHKASISARAGERLMTQVAIGWTLILAAAWTIDLLTRYF